MSDSKPRNRRWPPRVTKYLKDLAIDADDLLDSARRRHEARFGGRRPTYIEAYRGHADADAAELCGRLLATPPRGGPMEDDGWWDNLLNTYRRFHSREVPGVDLTLQFRGVEAHATTDHEGYYSARIATPGAAVSEGLWENAMVSLADGTLLTPQPVLQVGPLARFGIISDIDDTVLHSSVLDWKTAAQLAFLHNARTRKPLCGVARLYQALQVGADGENCNPVFYVSSSPWNLYDLLDDFIELNAIPFGPMFLRDFGLAPGKFIATPGHGHKLDRVRALIGRYPHLRWLLLGDSGQADAELYAEAAQEFGDRIIAIYIRDVDPVTDDPRDRVVDGHFERVAGTNVPMLRVGDSLAIAEHALALGLIADDSLAEVAREVQRDRQRPTLGEAAADEAKDAIAEGKPTVPGGS